jgi:hypothetical protein
MNASFASFTFNVFFFKKKIKGIMFRKKISQKSWKVVEKKVSRKQVSRKKKLVEKKLVNKKIRKKK